MLCLALLRDEICIPIPYVDDTTVFSKSFKGHINDVRTLLQRLCQYGVKLKSGKCEVFMHGVRNLGRIVSVDGSRMDPANTIAVRALRDRRPGAVGESRTIIGITDPPQTVHQCISCIAGPL